ncbi:hypothetical protein M011DRAFT_196565 [Sporormia fimetaria CBS 119925]|uniref:Uncharacterized protein n=1 Tax=Sporormia fimetaria CBS 119925 TaxID=1340428 RepID=A0A6A6V2F4_9PLEO|nr:hypothetical protein M011DRAFT_196565 [Sporormia fimetaria CBS 119925]
MPEPNEELESAVMQLNMAKANRALSEGQLYLARNIYTELLDHTPAQPAAFSNRSLCYMLLGLPHLAASDAYRAYIAADALQGHVVEGVKPMDNLKFSIFDQMFVTNETTDPWMSESRAGQSTRLSLVRSC